MMQSRTITDNLAIGDQPTEADLEALRRDGYAGVVNLRNDGEPDQPLSTAAEGERVRALGLDYLHYGVGGAPLTEDGVRSVRDFLDRHASEKVFLHCRKGSRAAALVLLYLAGKRGWKPEEALAKGKAIGLDVEGGLKGLVEHYLATHA